MEQKCTNVPVAPRGRSEQVAGCRGGDKVPVLLCQWIHTHLLQGIISWGSPWTHEMGGQKPWLVLFGPEPRRNVSST